MECRMKTITLGRKTKHKVRLMTEAEFNRFIANKTCYHYDLGMLNKWVSANGTPITVYFPYKGFLVGSRHTFVPSARGWNGCLQDRTTTGKRIWDLPRWSVTIRTNKDGKRIYYVTRK